MNKLNDTVPWLCNAPKLITMCQCVRMSDGKERGGQYADYATIVRLSTARGKLGRVGLRIAFGVPSCSSEAGGPLSRERQRKIVR